MGTAALQGPVDHRARRVVHTLAGALLIGLVLTLDPLLGQRWVLGSEQVAGVLVGLAVIGIGLVPLGAALQRLATGAALFLLTGVLALGLAEAAGRLLGLDFSKEEETFLQIPPCFRTPMTPTGDTFRRPGPQSWTGQVLNTRLKQLGVRPNPYEDEPVITVSYDADGFRNAPDLDDWDVVIVGDSFTESGYLPDEALFTTIVARGLGVRVKNLGVSETGPFTHVHYLREYGSADSVKDAVLMFYEGNDYRDVVATLQRRAQVEPVQRRFTPQPSLIRALADFLRPAAPNPRGTDVTHAYFESGDGGEIALSMYRVPPNRSELSSEAEDGLRQAIGEFASTARESGIRPWLAYVPVKPRVLFGLVRFTERASANVRAWTPTDLPTLIEELCKENSIEYLDLTPALRKETEERGVLLYNSIWDEHLNAEGSAIVGRELVRWLATAVETP